MKNIYFLIFLNLISINLNAVFTGEWVNKTHENGRTDHMKIFFYSDKLPYKKGGVKFNYPQNYFKEAPYIYISTELKGMVYSAALKIMPIIHYNSSQNAIIRINKELAGFFSTYNDEAETDDVYVYLFAFGY